MPMTLTDDEIKTVKSAFDTQSTEWTGRLSGNYTNATVTSAREAFVALVNNQVQAGRSENPGYTITDAMLELQKTHSTSIAL